MANIEIPEIVLDLTRHAHSAMQLAMEMAADDPNGVPFIGGRQNHIPLTELGREQALGHGYYSVEHNLVPDIIYSSKARRCISTSVLSATVTGHAIPKAIDDRLQELDQGKWTNMPRSIYDEPEVKAEMRAKGSNFAAPGGESINDVLLRGIDFIESEFAHIPPTPLTTRDAKPLYVVAFTHGVFTKAVLKQLLDWSHDRTHRTPIDNVSRTRLTRTAGKWGVGFISRPTVPADLASSILQPTP
jgi:broad specificity phosphatase PhoE